MLQVTHHGITDSYQVTNASSGYEAVKLAQETFAAEYDVTGDDVQTRVMGGTPPSAPVEVVCYYVPDGGDDDGV